MSLPIFRGRVAWIFADDNFDVDQIVGVKNIKITDVVELARLAMVSFDPDFARSVRAGDFIVGGRNFGYGHPHYPPLQALRYLGLSGVVAESFSPGFWRGEISMGTILATSPGILDGLERWDELELDYAAGEVRNLTQGRRCQVQPLSSSDDAVLCAGGLVAYLRQNVGVGGDGSGA